MLSSSLSKAIHLVFLFKILFATPNEMTISITEIILLFYIDAKQIWCPHWRNGNHNRIYCYFLPVIALTISKKLTAKCVAVKINAPLCWCLPFTFWGGWQTVLKWMHFMCNNKTNNSTKAITAECNWTYIHALYSVYDTQVLDTVLRSHSVCDLFSPYRQWYTLRMISLKVL